MSTRAKNKLQPVFDCSSLAALDPGSGREIPAIYIGAWHGLFTPDSRLLELVMGMGRFQAGVAFLA